MNLLLFIVVLVVSFIVVRIGAVAFQLTGIEWSMAKFQALSCFSGTGFTTKEAELIVSSPQRRRIASGLIILGNAGLVTLIATFANSLRPRTAGLPGFSLPFVGEIIPAPFLPWVNLIIIIVAVYVVYRLFTKSRLLKSLSAAAKKKLTKSELVTPVSFEEISVATGGFGISKIRVTEKSPVFDKRISESGFRKSGINILALVRGGDTIPTPAADTQILAGDELICFGKLDDIRAFAD